MDAEIGRHADAAALLAALALYETWLSNLEGPNLLGLETSLGQRELQKVLDLRRASFPNLTEEITGLLLAHVRIADAVYGHQLGVLRGTTRPVDDHELFTALAQTQHSAIERVRRAVAAADLAPSLARCAP